MHHGDHLPPLATHTILSVEKASFTLQTNTAFISRSRFKVGGRGGLRAHLKESIQTSHSVHVLLRPMESEVHYQVTNSCVRSLCTLSAVCCLLQPAVCCLLSQVRRRFGSELVLGGGFDVDSARNRQTAKNSRQKSFFLLASRRRVMCHDE